MQLEKDIDTVILLNKFTVKAEDIDQFLKVLATATEIFNHPGFILAQLHRSIGNSSTFFNRVVWKSAKDIKRDSDRPEFKDTRIEETEAELLSRIIDNHRSLTSV